MPAYKQCVRAEIAIFGHCGSVHVHDRVAAAAIGSQALEVLGASGSSGAGEASIVAAHSVGKRGAGKLKDNRCHSDTMRITV